MTNQFPSELVSWAENVIQACKPISEDYHLDYYAFQKPCNLHHKDLILALNPYSKDFQSQKKEDKILSTLTSEQLLNGNLAWDKNSSSWKIIRQLSKMKIIHDMQYKFNYMNYVYFPSKTFNDIKKIKEVDILEICKNLTLEFIDILKPERIILLGTSSGIDQFDGSGEVLLCGNNNKRLIVKSHIGNYDVFAIPHPSWLTDEELYSIDVNLKEIITAQKQSGFISDPKFSYVLRNDLDNSLQTLNLNSNNKNYSDIVIGGIEDDELLIRINYREKKLGVRNNKSKNFYELKGLNLYKSFFSNIVKENEDSWAFQKNFPNHFFASHNDIAREIFDLVKEINFLNNDKTPTLASQ